MPVGYPGAYVTEDPLVALALLAVAPATAWAVTRDGTRLADTLHGTVANDIMRGQGSRDALYGNAGNDLLSGGSAGDQLFGDAGDDELDGGSGNDRLEGGDGNDRLLGVTGNDVLEGGPGNDALDGFDGDDILRGGDGNDFLGESRFGDDRELNGGPGDDVILGNAGAEKVILGGDGNDLPPAAPGTTASTAGRATTCCSPAAANTRACTPSAARATTCSSTPGRGRSMPARRRRPVAGRVQGLAILQGGDGDDQLFVGTGTGSADCGPGNDVIAAANTITEDQASAMLRNCL